MGEYVRAYDADGDGVMGVLEFSRMLTEQINFVFDQFVGDSMQSLGDAMIRASDLQSIAQKLGMSLTDAEAEKMITFLDTGDHQISRDEFEQLILMPPEAMATSGKQQKKAKRTGDGKADSRKASESTGPKNRKTLVQEFMAPAVGVVGGGELRHSTYPLGSPKGSPKGSPRGSPASVNRSIVGSPP